MELEIWSYDPMLFALDGHVDVLSLYISLREAPDARVEQAVEEVMGRYSWYMGSV